MAEILFFPGARRTGAPQGEVAVALCVSGERLDPGEITQLLGRPPTLCCHAGERLGGEGPPSKRGAWLLELRAREPTTPEELCWSLLRSLPDDDELWELLRERGEIELRFSVPLAGSSRGVELSQRLITFIARCHAKLLFALSRDEEPAS